jgi:hypothetical protein
VFAVFVAISPSSQSLQQITACSPHSRPTLDSDGEMTPTNTPTPSINSSNDKLANSGNLFLILGPTPSEPLIVHPGAIIAILHLIPSVSYLSDIQVCTCNLNFYDRMDPSDLDDYKLRNSISIPFLKLNCAKEFLVVSCLFLVNMGLKYMYSLFQLPIESKACLQVFYINYY